MATISITAKDDRVALTDVVLSSSEGMSVSMQDIFDGLTKARREVEALRKIVTRLGGCDCDNCIDDESKESA